MQTALEQQKSLEHQKSLEINNIVNQIFDFSDKYQNHKDKIGRIYATNMDIMLVIMERFKAMRDDNGGGFTVT